jgi:cytochrome c-type biogenesis protein CcmE
MKKSHIIGIVVIAIAVFVIISTAGDASTYVTFEEAKTLFDEGNDKKVHVVGQLKTGKSGDILGVEPGKDMLTVTFLMVDNNNETNKVFYNKPMPPDLKQSSRWWSSASIKMTCSLQIKSYSSALQNMRKTHCR